MKEARERIEHLKSLYRRLKHKNTPDGSWDWFLRREIEALEFVLNEEHKKNSGVSA